MIKNDRQREVTLLRISQFEQTLADMEADSTTLAQHKLAQAGKDAVRSQLVSFRQELVEYDALRAGGPISFHPEDLAELPRLLIKARIAAGISEEELGGHLGLSEAQVFRMEEFEYAEADLDRLREVAVALGLKVVAALLSPRLRPSRPRSGRRVGPQSGH